MGGDVIEKLGLPRRLFADDVVSPGTVVGPLRPGVVDGADGAVVTASPGTTPRRRWPRCPAVPPIAYIASGTWSLVGLELPAPVLTEEARRLGFSNEAGVDGTVRFLRNGTGLWLLQRCREAWGGAAAPTYAELTRAAAREPVSTTLIDPDDPRFRRARRHAGADRGLLPGDRAAGHRPAGRPWCAASWTASPASSGGRWNGPRRSPGVRADVVHSSAAERPTRCCAS